MQTGKLDQRITFQTPVETNSSGSLAISYADTSPPDTVFAHVISEHGSEAMESARVNARSKVRVCVRYRADVVSTWRFVWEGQAYNIKHVDVSMRRDDELWLTGENTSVI